MRIFISGGAGFVGSQLALAFRKESASHDIVTLDNLRRRGIQINLPIFKRHGIRFIHGDIRNMADLEDVEGKFDLILDASAEPSVLAGINSSPSYVLQTNLVGTLNLLEFARKRAGLFLFLSTSKVYSIAPLRQLSLDEGPTRFSLAGEPGNGYGREGFREDFPTYLARSIYGATKLSSELIIQEYAHTYGLKAIINRCGIIAGSGQFGKVDQGIFTLWAIHHHFRKPLSYIGFGGKGKQVRDLLHPSDLFSLIRRQIETPRAHGGEVYNVGGGLPHSLSLFELTQLCRELTGREVPIGSVAETTSVDVPWYVTDSEKAMHEFGWKPRMGARAIIEDVLHWARENEALVAPLFT